MPLMLMLRSYVLSIAYTCKNISDCIFTLVKVAGVRLKEVGV